MLAAAVAVAARVALEVAVAAAVAVAVVAVAVAAAVVATAVAVAVAVAVATVSVTARCSIEMVSGVCGILVLNVEKEWPSCNFHLHKIKHLLCQACENKRRCS